MNDCKIECTKSQLKLIQKALDFYSRIGTGQFDVIVEHPTFKNCLYAEFSPNNIENVQPFSDWKKLHEKEDNVKNQLHVARNILCGDEKIGANGHWSIGNSKVDESCREAFEILQKIRHQFWLAKPNRNNSTVDAIDRKSTNVKVTLN